MAYSPVITKRRRAAIMAARVDHRLRTTVPIRDLYHDGRIVFLVDIYGWTGRDICMIPGGSDPIVHAVRRLGLNPDRYQATIFDAQID